MTARNLVSLCVMLVSVSLPDGWLRRSYIGMGARAVSPAQR